MKTAPAKTVRYDYLIDPLDYYLIWDRATDLPCVDDSRILTFATEEEALEVLCALNDH